MAKAKPVQRGFFRIKDIETGLYYHKRNIMIDKKAGYSADNWTHWTAMGDIWTFRGSCESMLTRLTKTYKDKRDTTAKRVLFGNKETARLIIVECDIVDKS